MVRTRWGAVAAAAGTVALLVSSCGSAKYKFVDNSAEGNYLKVPSRWTLFHLTEQDAEGRPIKLPVDTQRIWHIAFDADPKPDQAHLTQPQPANVVGDVEIYALSSSDNDQVSQSRLRQIVFGGIDPILQDPGTPAKWEVVSYAPIAESNGIVGSRTVINVPSPDKPNTWLTVDGSELFDATKGRAYLLSMRCDSQCYLNTRSSIDQIATSWRVNP
jgi:hypothetical protein